MLQNRIRYIGLLVCLLAACKGRQKTVGAGIVKNNSDESSVLTESAQMRLNDLFIDANKEKILGDFNKSAALFAKCLEIDSKNHASFFELSKLHSNLKNLALFDYKKALYYAQKARALDNNNPWYIEHLAMLYELNGKLGAAGEQYKSLIALQNYNLEHYAKLAGVLEAEKKYKEAIEVYQQIEDKSSITDMTSFKKSDLYLTIGEDEKAISELEKLIAQYPSQADYYQKLAECYLKTGNEQGALKTYERLTLIEADNPHTHLFLSQYYQKKGDTLRAFTEMRQAFENKELSIDTKIEVLLNYYVASEKEPIYKKQSFELLEVLTQVHPQDPKAHSMAGDFYFRDSLYTKAQASFLKAIEYDKTRYPVWNQLFIIDLELKEYDHLAAHAGMAKEYFPTQSIVYYFEGFGLSQTKEYEASAKALEEGKELCVGNSALLVQFHSMLGDVYNNLKKYDLSDGSYDAALSLEPDNVGVLNNYAYYLSLRKVSLEKAKKMSEKTLEKEPKSATYADTYAWVLYQNKEYEKALEWMEKAITWDGGKSGTLYEHYGDVLYQLGKRDLAMEQWKKASTFEDVSDKLPKKLNDGVLYE